VPPAARATVEASIAASLAAAAEPEPRPEPRPEPEPEPALAAEPPVLEPVLDPEPVPAAVVPPEPPPAPPEPPPPVTLVPGVHRVVVHTLEGQVKRGVLEDAQLAADSLALVVQPGGAPEPITTDRVKAIFFMLAPGEQAPAPEGRKVRVTFRDGRQVAGLSPDYREGAIGFFMIPADSRTNTGRIWVYQAAVKQVALS
jgi:hypothetical protein